MKYLIAVVFLISIVMAPIPPRDRCDIVTARIALPVRIFAETTIDGRDQPVLITRFFHNKVTIIASELGRCYFNFFDPNLIVASASLLGLFPWFYFAYRIAILSPRYPLLAALFIIPALPIIVTAAQVAHMHKVFAIIGLVLLTKR